MSDIEKATVDFDNALRQYELRCNALGAYMPALATKLRLHADTLSVRYPDIDTELARLREDNERLRYALSTAREEGRLEGLEEAATHMEQCATLMSDYATQMAYRTRATAIRALKEKQP